VTIGRLWGEEALRKFKFRDVAGQPVTSGLAGLLRPRLPRME
jgi:hypothetical protein